MVWNNNLNQIFQSICYIKRNKDDLGKFDSRTAEGIFLGYSSSKKEYRCLNKRLHKIVESAYVIIDDIKPRSHDSAENTNNEDLQEDNSTHNEEEGIYIVKWRRLPKAWYKSSIYKDTGESSRDIDNRW